MAGRQKKVPSENLALCAAQRDLRNLSEKLGDIYDVSLPVPDFPSLASMKEFCTGLLPPFERPISGGLGSTRHDWTRPMSGLSSRQRLSISGSLFLFRKVLPSDPPSLDSYMDRMSIESPPPDPGFLRFCSKELAKIFPVGWDRGWRGCVAGTTLRPSSCLESSRKRGGNLGCLEREEWISREGFCKELLDRYSPFKPNVNRVRLALAPCEGKTRIVSVNSVDMTVLDPYHRLVYDRVSSFDWCLRGEASARCFRDFTTRDGEVFVSGDYESATDNLNIHVARHIMSVINRSCFRVPLFVRDAASQLLDCTAFSGNRSVQIRRGQLMGNSMSFPLLCLQNYLAFRWFVGPEAPVRINGDDIVFRACPELYARWRDGVSSCGLTLSVGKTLVRRRQFSLNSTFFEAGTRYVRLAPVIRSTAFFKKMERPSALVGRVATLRGFPPPIRSRLVAWMLSRFSGFIWRSQRSLRRGWGMRVSTRALAMARLLERESFYLSLDKFHDPGFPEAQDGYFVSAIPEGWCRVWSRAAVSVEDQRAFAREVVENSWKPKKMIPKPEVLKWTARFVHLDFRAARWLGIGKRAVRSIRTALPPSRSLGRARWVRRSGALLGACGVLGDLENISLLPFAPTED